MTNDSFRTVDDLHDDGALFEFRTMGNNLILLESLCDFILKSSPMQFYHPDFYVSLRNIKTSIQAARACFTQQLRFTD